MNQSGTLEYWVRVCGNVEQAIINEAPGKALSSKFDIGLHSIYHPKPGTKPDEVLYEFYPYYNLNSKYYNEVNMLRIYI